VARFLINSRRRDEPAWPDLAYVAAIGRREQLPLHRSLPGYAPTPLRDLPALAAELGVASVQVKDEGGRFGLQAFKGLGASYAAFSVLRERWHDRTGRDLAPADFAAPAIREALGVMTFAAATDGNHGRAVAWTARLLGQRAVIFMPDDSAPVRIGHVRREGAEVRLIAGTFDDCVAACAEAAAAAGWQVIADTAYPGNMEIPGAIMTGYSTMFVEIAAQLEQPCDVMLLPAGVGGLFAAGAAHSAQEHGVPTPRLVCVEPEDAACFLESAAAGDGRPHAARGRLKSLMAGLNCGLPSLLAWPVVRDTAAVFLAIEDPWAVEAMVALHRHGIVAGESGAAPQAGRMAQLRDDTLAPARTHLGLGADCRVLVVNTESDTDPEFWARVTGATPDKAGGMP
jgi:diaminopropionate ammonia-lyase